MKRFSKILDWWLASAALKASEDRGSRTWCLRQEERLRRLLLWVEKYGIYLASIPALLLLHTLGQVLFSRSAFPFDLEWIEGGQLLHAHRLLRGQEIYTEPLKGFMPYSYPPGHTLILSLFGSVFGLDYWVGRFVSLGAMSGAVFLLAREVHRQFVGLGAPYLWPVLAVGSMVAAFPLTAGWYDLIRKVDILGPIRWDVSEFVDHEAHLRIVDFDPTAHILVDQICH